MIRSVIALGLLGLLTVGSQVSAQEPEPSPRKQPLERHSLMRQPLHHHDLHLNMRTRFKTPHMAPLARMHLHTRFPLMRDHMKMTMPQPRMRMHLRPKINVEPGTADI
jgi:hypothetical protein